MSTKSCDIWLDRNIHVMLQWYVVPFMQHGSYARGSYAWEHNSQQLNNIASMRSRKVG